MKVRWFSKTQEQRFLVPWWTGEVEEYYKKAETHYKAWKKVEKNGPQDKITENKNKFLNAKLIFDNVRQSVKKRIFKLPKSQRTVQARVQAFNKTYNQKMAIPKNKDEPITKKKNGPIPKKDVVPKKVPRIQTNPRKQSDAGNVKKVRPSNSRNVRNRGMSRQTNPRSQDLIQQLFSGIQNSSLSIPEPQQFNPRNDDFGNYPRNGPNYSNAQGSFDSRSYNQNNNTQNLYGPQNQEFRRDFGFDNTPRNNYQYQNPDNYQRNNYNSSGQMNNYNSMEPINNYNSRGQMNNYNSREPMNNYNNPDAPILAAAFGHILEATQKVLASNRRGFNNSRRNNRR